MPNDHPGLDEALNAALARIFTHHMPLVDGGSLLGLNHRLAHYLENGCKTSLLLDGLFVDLAWDAPGPELGPVPRLRPDVAVHDGGDSPKLVLAIECRRNRLGPADKQRLLGLTGHPGTFDAALGIAWRPGAPYFLFYYIGEKGVSFKRIRKQKPRIPPECL